MNTIKTRSRRNAFTLIEIMVATVIMVILVGLVIQITSEVLKVWNRSSGKLAANAEARIALDLLTQDLETAVFRNNGLQWMEAVQEEVVDPLDGGVFKTTRLLLFAPALDRPKKDADDNDIPGDICAISYQLMYQDPVDGSNSPLDNTFALHRRVIDPKTTFERLLGEGNQNNFTIWNGATEGSTVASSVPRNAGSPYPYTGDPENYLCSNIVDFRVKFYYVDSSNNEQVISDFKYGGDSADIGPGSAIEVSLTYAEISLIVISDEAMELLGSGNLAQTGMNEQEYIAANSETFTRRVNFLARPL